MPVEIRISLTKNRLYVRMIDVLQESESADAANRVIAEMLKLRPGFDVITDITTFKPSSAKALADIMRTQKAYRDHGIRRLVRIIGRDVIAKMQARRTGQEAAALDADYVHSLEEAERLLDSLGKSTGQP